MKNGPSWMFDHRSTSVVPTIDAAYTTVNPPAPGVPPTAYWGRWTGYVRFPIASRFAFTLPLTMKIELATASGTAVPMTVQGTTRSTNAAVVANTDYRIVVTTNVPTATVSMRWRSLGGTPAVPDNIVPTTALRPAVVPGSVPAAYVDPVIARQVDVRWTAVGGATGYQVARGGDIPTVDYKAPLTGATLQTSAALTDPNSLEAQQVVYAIKAGFPNPVTGGTTLSAPALAGAIVPGTMKLAVAGTAAGELTLFWNGRFSPGGGFRVYESTTFGTLGTLMTPTPVATVNPKPDLQEAYLHVLTNRPLNEERFYTVVAVDSAGNETARSDQEPGEALTLGLPWRSTNPSDVTEALRTRLNQAAPGFLDTDRLTISGPDGSRYVRQLSGTSSFRNAYDQLYNEPGQVAQDGDVRAQQSPSDQERTNTTPRRYANIWRRTGAGLYRKAEAGRGYYGLDAIFTLPTTISMRPDSSAYVYTGGSIVREAQDGTLSESSEIDIGLFLGFNGNRLINNYWRVWSNTGESYRLANGTVLDKSTQSVDTKVRIVSGPFRMTFFAMDCQYPGQFPDLLVISVSGPPGAFTTDNGTALGGGNHIAFRGGWRNRNQANMVVKRTNSIAQKDAYSLNFVRAGNIYRNGDRAFDASWGVPSDPNGMRLFGGGTMEDGTMLGIGNVPASGEETTGSGGRPPTGVGFDAASFRVRDRFFHEDQIFLQAGAF